MNSLQKFSFFFLQPVMIPGQFTAQRLRQQSALNCLQLVSMDCTAYQTTHQYDETETHGQLGILRPLEVEQEDDLQYSGRNHKQVKGGPDRCIAERSTTHHYRRRYQHCPSRWLEASEGWMDQRDSAPDEPGQQG